MSIEAFSGAPILSHRSRANVLMQCTDERVCPWDEYVRNPYGPQNPDGFVSLAYAENKLIWDHVCEWFKGPLTQAESLYDYTFGGARLRRGMVRLLSKTTSKALNPLHLVGGDGALSVLENLAFCLFDAGQTVALLVPCYVQHRNAVTYRNQLQIEEASSFAELLDVVRSGRVHGVLWTNPSNPLGAMHTRAQVAQLVEACASHRVHLISDEVYATCVFSNDEMISVLDFCTSQREADYVHVVTGLAKLGWSGAKIGFVYTESQVLVTTMRALSRMAPVATPGAVAATRMLTANGNVLQSLLQTNAKLLREQYQTVVTLLERARIPYCPAYGGLTLVLDLRAVAARLAPGWAGEETLFQKLVLEARVHLAAGRDFGFREPGYFRMTFAEPLDAIVQAIERVRALLCKLDTHLDAERDSIMQRYRQLWARTDQVFGLLRDDAFLERPIALRQPFLFYLGHLPAFAWNQLVALAPDTPQFDAELAALFERGIDPDVDTGAVHANSAGTQRAEWPTLERVLAFRNRVRELMPSLVRVVLANGNASADALAQHAHAWELQGGRIFELVYEHEAMHQETLLYMFNTLRLACFRADAVAALCAPMGVESAPVLELDTNFAHIPANKFVKMGASVSGPFGWDNEFPETVAAVDAFSIRKTPITNGEFLPFVASGAYAKQELWDADDWAWVQKERIVRPLHWVPTETAGVWKLRVIVKEIALEGAALLWPVQVSLAEAKAWCRWKGDGSRLPTEVEWYHAAYSESSAEGGFKYRQFPWGSQDPTRYHGNFDFASFTPTPVQQYGASCSYWGLFDLLGNGWEWTATPFAGFPGFAPVLSTYAGYSADFFDGKHFVLRGGSFATVHEELRRSFRNWYQGRYPFVFSKFRPVRPAHSTSSSSAIVRLEKAASAEQTLRDFAAHVHHGLSLPHPELSSLYFYDDAGSAIYEEITRLDEYYLTRKEHAILRSCVGQLADILGKEIGQTFNLMEFGAGDGHKTQTLIDHFVSLSYDVTYYPIDISEGALVSLLSRVKAPRICPLAANNAVGCAYVVSQTALPTLALFLGSSIGNYDVLDAIAFLRLVQESLRVGDFLLIGFDLKKDIDTLRAAYSDSKGVTARFNINLLQRMNRELGANFDTTDGVWQHRALWNPNVGAMESWIIPTRTERVTFGPMMQNASFAFHEWEGIRVERSHKYTLPQIDEIAAGSGFTVVKNWVDGYCVSLFQKKGSMERERPSSAFSPYPE